ncbi:MAG: hypothetical protein A3B95_04300 [Candidatus Doudnabacteria bacterium RIFCSPHIGHO2_02_FULL_43_13b]|nr:MAG: hypothetical protein A3B95_04300 [Candidatus Doudnabacteria bacterium RIFCSPHIGHO2_02_FULL_43_13b]
MVRDKKRTRKLTYRFVPAAFSAVLPIGKALAFRKADYRSDQLGPRANLRRQFVSNQLEVGVDLEEVDQIVFLFLPHLARPGEG